MFIAFSEKIYKFMQLKGNNLSDTVCIELYNMYSFILLYFLTLFLSLQVTAPGVTGNELFVSRAGHSWHCRGSLGAAQT